MLSEQAYARLRGELDQAWGFLELARSLESSAKTEEWISHALRGGLAVYSELRREPGAPRDEEVEEALGRAGASAPAAQFAQSILAKVARRLGNSAPRGWRVRRAQLFFAAAACVAVVLALGFVAREFGGRFSSKGATVLYYKGESFEKPICRRSEMRMAKNFGKSRPALFVPRDHFSARWEAFLVISSNDLYRFYLQSKDGSRLRIDGNVVIDHWDALYWRAGGHGELSLASGVHAITLEYYHHVGEAVVRLGWSGGAIQESTTMGVPYLYKTRAAGERFFHESTH